MSATPIPVRVARRTYRAARKVLPRRRDAEYGDELQAFFDERSDDAYRAGGVGRLAGATTSALLDLAQTGWQERQPGKNVTTLMRTLPREARAAHRSLRGAPAFSAGVVVALLLGVGVGSALFSIVHAALLAPLPFADEERLVAVAMRRSADAAERAVSYPDYADWRVRVDAFAGSLAAYSPTNRTVTGIGPPARVAVTLVTANFFATLGVPMAEGRAFRSDEERAGADGVAIVSHAFRAAHYATDGPVVGRTIRLSERPYQIVGVLPESFRFDLEPAEVFLPLGLTENDRVRRDSRWLGVIGRLRTGVALGRAADELAAASQDPSGHGVETGAVRPDIRPLRAAIVGDVSRMMSLLAGASLLVALAAAASVGGLGLARAVARRREMAVRTALGAPLGALVAAFSMEFALLGAGGAIAAAVVGAWTARAGVRLLPEAIAARATYLAAGAPRGRLLVFALGLTVLSALPALALAARDLRRFSVAAVLRSGAGHARTRQAGRMRGALVAAQVALAFVLATGAGLIGRSVIHLLDVDPGFSTDRLLALSVSIPVDRYANPPSVVRFYEALTERVGALTGVDRAAVVDEMPLSKDSGLVEVAAGDAPQGDRVTAVIRSASPGYFATLGLRAEAGRLFDRADRADRPAVAVITKTLARRLFPDRDPVGRRLQLTRSTGAFEIIGVVGDVRMGELDRPMAPAFYTCSLQDPSRSAQLVVRTSMPVDRLVTLVRSEAALIDPDIPVYRVTTFGQARDATRGVASRRLVLYPLLLFAGLATTIAVLGVYALMSYAVCERLPEIGLRVALGASRAAVWRLVLRAALVPTMTGVGTGLVICLLAAGGVEGWLFGVSARDPVTLAISTSGLLTLALLAAAGPASRAARADPQVVMRRE